MHRTARLIVVAGLVFSPAAAAQPSAWPCDPKCFDAGVRWDSRTHYLFKGGEYISYSDGKPEAGFPRSIDADWKGLAEFSSGIDAAVSWGNGRIYFFKGDRYVRYEVSPSGYGEYYAPEPLSGNWPFPATWLSGINAGVNWGNGKIYFFRGADYLTYDIATNEAGRPRPISVGWKAFPKSWWAGVDAAIDWGNGGVYFFKGKQYLRYLIAPDGTAKNFGPKSISEGEVFISEISGSGTTQ